jgi:gluconate 2-dehydrogenase gamma chain
MREDFLAGTAALDRRSERMFKVGFAQATPEQQDQLLTLFKDSPAGSGEAHYYELLMVLSLEGFLGDPSYGGNKGRVGWALVGFNTVGLHASEPPPGYDGQKHLHHHHGH